MNFHPVEYLPNQKRQRRILQARITQNQNCGLFDDCFHFLRDQDLDHSKLLNLKKNHIYHDKRDSIDTFHLFHDMYNSVCISYNIHNKQNSKKHTFKDVHNMLLLRSFK